jgi:hypothetical protein
VLGILEYLLIYDLVRGVWHRDADAPHQTRSNVVGTRPSSEIGQHDFFSKSPESSKRLRFCHAVLDVRHSLQKRAKSACLFHIITATRKSLILVIIAGVAGILSATSGCVPSSRWHWYFNRNIE